MSIAAAMAANFGWSWDEIKDAPVSVMFLMWRQLAYQADEDVGWSLEDLDLIETMKTGEENGI